MTVESDINLFITCTSFDMFLSNSAMWLCVEEKLDSSKEMFERWWTT